MWVSMWLWVCGWVPGAGDGMRGLNVHEPQARLGKEQK